ncbi:ran guanine nucleotide release factor-like [Liolophura sinensis]|uniref:ran guanine nucleotide release factor-like n=1 Tax=Liolophura sinensis TaxID=3198878 RepID=UPI0031594ABE
MGGKEKLLFGTALSVVLPENAKDVSGIRDIPDNQEVFCHPVTDQSFIIELLEFVDGTDEEAIKTHFEDLASCNEASASAQIIRVEEIPVQQTSMGECTSVWQLSGRQNVAKFHDTAENIVNVHMGVIRLTEYRTDIVITFNDPVLISPESSSYAPIPTSAGPWQVEDFHKAVTSLQLLDPGIFSD